ncbi:MAG: transporter associated domain-containing protein [Gammaproteobacteria bacterium]|jgi:magnesium and cobalt transporter|nr:transporter associated domain-containing protein [Gammaproteobacteria bacterium]
MNDSQPASTEPQQRSWLDRISKALTGSDGPRNREELLESLREAQQRGLIDAEALVMLEGVLEVNEMQVGDIMIPRAQMVVVQRDATLEEILPILAESQHSRFPVIGESRDEVLGIMLAKDLLPYFASSREKEFHVGDILRPALFIPESKRLNVLLKEFRSSRNHIALVVDEYGGIDGMVTIEDVLEQIVGEIVDEHDVDDQIYIMKHGERHFTVKALTPIDEFNDYFGAAFSDEEFDTIGGLVMSEFGRLPRRGETLDVDRFRFKVLHADSRRVHLLQVVPATGEAAVDASATRAHQS